MSLLSLNPDAAIGILMFSHRHGWDGTICKAATGWNCGSPQEFRDMHCAVGKDRCHAIHAFNRVGPRLRLKYDTLNWLLSDDIHLLDGRIMLLWAKAAKGDYGIVAGPPAFRLAGAYRIARIEKSGFGEKFSWEIFPQTGAWCRYAEIGIAPPPFTETPSSFCKIIEGESVRAHFRRVEERLAEDPEVVPQESDRERVASFIKALPTWQEELRERAKKAAPNEGLKSSPFAALGGLQLRTAPSAMKAAPPLPKDLPVQMTAPIATIKTVQAAKAPVAVAANKALVPTLVDAGSATKPPSVGFMESEQLQEELNRKYGQGVVKALLSAAISKKIVVLRGLPGSGKSHLARRLLDDQQMERTFIQPVSATWRGAEDLLGYLNPVDRKFQPTPFSQFLVDAAKAWDSGDHRHRVVIFEEFNLSQPEYWLTDILVRLEYPAEDRGARTLQLAPGHALESITSVYLSPALRFVATLNNDHTTRPLSPRVLDRAAVIELRVSPEVALDSQQVTLNSDELEAVRGLNFALRLKGISFSHRTARSLKACLEGYAKDAPRWPYLDVVLAMEILSKVRLLAANPSDEAALAQLEKWADECSSELPECGRLIRGWREMFDAGQDIIQA